jgi:hypothetical protein
MYCHDGTAWRLVFGNGWMPESAPRYFDQIESLGGILYLVEELGGAGGTDIYTFDGSNFSLYYSFAGTYENIKDICVHNGKLHAITENSVYRFDTATPTFIGFDYWLNSISSVGGELYLHAWGSSSSQYDVIKRYVSGTTWTTPKRASIKLSQIRRGAIVDYQGWPYLCSSNGVYYDDGGTNLVPLGSLPYNCYCGHYSPGNGLYVMTSDGLYVWGGSSWTKASNVAAGGGGIHQKSMTYNGVECFQRASGVYYLSGGSLIQSVGGPAISPYYLLNYDMCIHNEDLWGVGVSLHRCIGQIG